MDAMAVYASAHKVNRIRDYLEGLAWDGIPRLDRLLIAYFGAEDSPYVQAVTRKTLTAAVARAMAPGVKFDSMLILSGAQGLGKSTFFRLLGMDWYSDSLSTFEERTRRNWCRGIGSLRRGS